MTHRGPWSEQKRRRSLAAPSPPVAHVGYCLQACERGAGGTRRARVRARWYVQRLLAVGVYK